jgi:predicted  nucleic acid-binding Zn-ribbon protein
MKRQTVEQIDASLKRWKTRAKRAATAIDKLEKQRKRLIKTGTLKPATPDVTDLFGMPVPLARPSEVAFYPDVKRGALDDAKLDIPEFLRRGAAAQSAADDAVVAEQIKAEQAETKRLKAQGRIAKMKAKKSGDMKRMPLTGKAALAHIRGESK